MKNKFLINLLLIFYSTQSTSQKALSINFQLAPTISSFEAFDANNSIFVYKGFGYKKERIGICYGLELEKEFSKKFSMSIGFSKLSYKSEYEAVERLPTSNYRVTGSLRNTLNFYTATLNYNFLNNSTKKFFVGLGVHLVDFKNQYFEVDASQKGYKFSEYFSTEGGLQFQLGYEKKIKENVNFGFNSRIYYIISVDALDNISFGPYLKVNL